MPAQHGQLAGGRDHRDLHATTGGDPLIPLNGLDLQNVIVDRSDLPIIFITGYGGADEGVGDEGLVRRILDQAVRR